MAVFEFPSPLTGDTKADLENLWKEYWKLVEQLTILNGDLERMRKEAGA